jgi:hypothetical protein
MRRLIWAACVAGCASPATNASVLIEDGVGSAGMFIDVRVITSSPCPGDTSGYHGTYEGVALVSDGVAWPCGWPELSVSGSALAQLDASNPTIELDDPASSLAVHITLPPGLTPARTLSIAPPGPNLCFDQSYTLDWGGSFGRSVGTTPVRFDEDADASDDNFAFAAAGSDIAGGIVFVAASGSGVPGFPTGGVAGQVSAAPDPLGAGEISDCDGAAACSYDISNARSLAMTWVSCGSAAP